MEIWIFLVYVRNNAYRNSMIAEFSRQNIACLEILLQTSHCAQILQAIRVCPEPHSGKFAGRFVISLSSYSHAVTYGRGCTIPIFQLFYCAGKKLTFLGNALVNSPKLFFHLLVGTSTLKLLSLVWDQTSAGRDKGPTTKLFNRTT